MQYISDIAEAVNDNNYSIELMEAHNQGYDRRACRSIEQIKDDMKEWNKLTKHTSTSPVLNNPNIEDLVKMVASA